jgi:glycosyltransferase involved in cell wall biosynthesis
MQQNTPTFTIITVVFNSLPLLKGTVESVKQQSFQHYEHLIIDGASKDDTPQYLQQISQQNGSKIRFISEKDKGLYDAMNKSFALATGDFLLFLNAGDHLFESDTLQKLAQQITPQTDIIYGEVMLVDDARTHVGTRSQCSPQRLPDALTWRSMRFGMVVCHQAFLVRRQLPPPQYIAQNLSADIDWVIRCLKNSRQTVHSHQIIAEYLMGGLSKKRHRQSLQDRYNILQQHFGFVPNLFAHAWIIVRAAFFKVFNAKSY